MSKLDYIRTAFAKWHMTRYCKLMSKVVGKKITAEDIYRRLFRV